MVQSGKLKKGGAGGPRIMVGFRSGTRFRNEYLIQHKIGRGGGGGIVYRALHEQDTEKEPVALKFPARDEECEALQVIYKTMPGPYGVAPLLDIGPQVVITELLGPPISSIFRDIRAKPMDCRWKDVSLIGRILFRSLQAIHERGIVHCDVQPNNILLGRSDSGEVRPFFIDFGCARAWPNGPPMAGTWGSIDFNSARSANGGVRTAYDDLEALGWMMCHMLHGELPWFEWTREAWLANWQENRDAASKKVQDAKSRVCRGGWGGLLETPDRLHRFLVQCWRGGSQGPPDYARLISLLQSDDGPGAAQASPSSPKAEARERDHQLFNDLVLPLIPEQQLADPGMKLKRRQIPEHLCGHDGSDIEVAPWQRAHRGWEGRSGAGAGAQASAPSAPSRASSPPTPKGDAEAFDFDALEGTAPKRTDEKEARRQKRLEEAEKRRRESVAAVAEAAARPPAPRGGAEAFDFDELEATAKPPEPPEEEAMQEQVRKRLEDERLERNRDTKARLEVIKRRQEELQRSGQHEQVQEKEKAEEAEAAEVAERPEAAAAAEATEAAEATAAAAATEAGEATEAAEAAGATEVAEAAKAAEIAEAAALEAMVAGHLDEQEVDVLVYIQRDMDIKTTVKQKLGATVWALKETLSKDDPTGDTRPQQISLWSPMFHRELKDSEQLTGNTVELDLVLPPNA
eukprot:CAMPEP_0180483334 /NCGR_PEP_ID=MMETSP1036_2-20121128/35369_1 /TAXON_ID=632150 /ORGANISM="Azadinium spinosum, Strain 3D9" /LENGTH=686 /DNA_ID=CAMNT_0022491139 /DNA_START=8 /DNA_END=2068 /DNA_ORIENTATION=-